jgi:hypothetical protein
LLCREDWSAAVALPEDDPPDEAGGGGCGGMRDVPSSDWLELGPTSDVPPESWFISMPVSSSKTPNFINNNNNKLSDNIQCYNPRKQQTKQSVMSIYFVNITNSIEQNSSKEGISHSSDQEVTHFLCYAKVYCCFNKSTPQVCYPVPN